MVYRSLFICKYINIYAIINDRYRYISMSIYTHIYSFFFNMILQKLYNVSLVKLGYPGLGRSESKQVL